MRTLPVMEKVLAKSRQKTADSMRVWTFKVVRILILSVFFTISRFSRQKPFRIFPQASASHSNIPESSRSSIPRRMPCCSSVLHTFRHDPHAQFVNGAGQALHHDGRFLVLLSRPQQALVQFDHYPLSMLSRDEVAVAGSKVVQTGLPRPLRASDR